MLTPLLRGDFTPPDELTEYLTRLDLRRKRFRHLQHIRQLHRLKKTPHDIVLDIAPMRKTFLLVFFFHRDKPTTVMVQNFFGKGQTSAKKIDLGPGISPAVFSGTVVEVKDWDNTFQVYDLLYWKGVRVENRSDAFDELAVEVIPFLSQPRLYVYDDISSLAENRLLFLPKTSSSLPSDDIWVFTPPR